MSCGTKIVGRNWGYWEKDDIASKLESAGESSLADKVRHDECLGWYELNEAKSALERQGMDSYDYREERCRCEEEEHF